MIAPPCHPGPPRALRIASLACRAHPLRLRLRAGLPFDRAVAEAFAEQGFEAGYLRLHDVGMARIDYVRPAPAPAPGHGPVAWYSAIRRLAPARIAEAGVHLGRRGGTPFVHGHGLWRGADEDAVRMGHLLGPECHLDAEIEAEGWGLRGAMFSVEADAETGFSLFAPQGVADPKDGLANDPAGGLPAVLCALRPHVDLHAGLAEAAARHGLQRARIEGLGSLVGATFADATDLDSLATEMLVTQGEMQAGRARISAAAIGFDGGPSRGLLREGGNAICVTGELLLIGN